MLAAQAGAGFVGISPVHALFPSDPSLYSPYSASSRHALNVMFIDVASVPEVRENPRAQALMDDPAFRTRLAQVRALRQVDYAAVATLKMPVLQAAFDRFRAEHLVAAHGTVRRISRFPARARRAAAPAHLVRRHRFLRCAASAPPARAGTTGRRSTGGRTARPCGASPSNTRTTVDFHGYLQWIAAEQLVGVRARARELGLSVGLYGDYAVGVNASGSETWSDQTLYCMGAAIGAPPDPLGVAGQEWGIPPQDPRALQRAAYAPFAALLRASMRACGALRLDHVMALFRQWWVPRGFKSADGGYVHYPLEDLLGVVALESHRNQCLVVGEDLGVVPDEIRRSLPQFGVYHYKVVLFEQKNGEFVAPADYVRHALAAVTTHDLPTLRGWWSGHDIDLWEKLGFYADSSVGERNRAERQQERLRLLRALRRENLWDGDGDDVPPYSAELGRAVHVYLGKSEAALVTVQLEDMIGMLEPVNVPGTSSEYSNWTRRMTESAREIFARPEVRELAAAMRAARNAT